MAKKTLTTMAGLLNADESQADNTIARPVQGADFRDVAGVDPVQPAEVSPPAEPAKAKANLNFKVEEEFKKKFKLLAIRKGLNLTELLELAISKLEGEDKSAK